MLVRFFELNIPNSCVNALAQSQHTHLTSILPFPWVLRSPHDVLFYPATFNDSGYNASMLTGDIKIPPTWQEDMSTKPAVQAQFIKIFQASGVVATPDQARNYL